MVREGRGRRRARNRSSGVAAQELCRKRSYLGQAVFLEGPARLLPAGGGTVWLGASGDEAAFDERWTRPDWLGNGNSDDADVSFSFQGPGEPRPRRQRAGGGGCTGDRHGPVHHSAANRRGGIRGPG